MNYRPSGPWLHVIHGCMYSGKSEMLIAEAIRARIGKKKVIMFKPDIDQRFDGDNISVNAKSGSSFPAHLISCDNPEKILELSNGYDVICIDEVQFFDGSITDIIRNILSSDNNVAIIVAGLNQNYRGEVFGSMGELLAMSDSNTRLYAVCHKCGEPIATKTQRLKSDGSPASYNEPLVVVGAQDKYEARCCRCYQKPT